MYSNAALLLLAFSGAAASASFEALSKQAAEARDAKHPDEALALYQKALKLKPDWQEGWWEAGSIAYDQNKYADCAPDFHRLASLINLGSLLRTTIPWSFNNHAG